MNIYQRILEVMKEVDYIQKDPKKTGQQYSTVPHDKVTAKLHPVLVKFGIAVIPSIIEHKQEGNRTSVTLETKFHNVDHPEDFITVRSFGYGVDSSDKGPGKATSYAFKYALLKLFCLETGDDPEHDQDTQFEPSKEKLTTESFMKQMGISINHVATMNEFIKMLSKEMDRTEIQVMLQALEPSQKSLFLHTWDQYLEA